MSTRTVGTYLRDLRERRGESLRRTASNLGLAASQLSRMERDQRSLGSAAERLADYYAVPIAELRPDVPADVLDFLRQHPEEVERLRARRRP
ncbi:helix-turn-helix domain-containing protein [Curtobacterium flaccumfaciens]|uniref:helix-turn-helix domain-containing protein n=1 Tax=Curtobacterium flaccumfaciens TaxID=2035 RepID=UPI003558E11F